MFYKKYIFNFICSNWLDNWFMYNCIKVFGLSPAKADGAIL